MLAGVPWRELKAVRTPLDAVSCPRSLQAARIPRRAGKGAAIHNINLRGSASPGAREDDTGSRSRLPALPSFDVDGDSPSHTRQTRSPVRAPSFVGVCGWVHVSARRLALAARVQPDNLVAYIAITQPCSARWARALAGGRFVLEMSDHAAHEP